MTLHYGAFPLYRMRNHKQQDRLKKKANKYMTKQPYSTHFPLQKERNPHFLSI